MHNMMIPSQSTDFQSRSKLSYYNKLPSKQIAHMGPGKRINFTGRKRADAHRRMPCSIYDRFKPEVDLEKNDLSASDFSTNQRSPHALSIEVSQDQQDEDLKSNFPYP